MFGNKLNNRKLSNLDRYWFSDEFDNYGCCQKVLQEENYKTLSCIYIVIMND